jgi:diacylglycerol O-acyltransferase
LAIKRAVRRVTINDIAMACIAGAMREYLQHHNKLPARSLSSGVPISLRGPADIEAGGNKIATMVVGLGTQIADPLERLRLIHRYAVAGKKQIKALGTGTVMDISDSLAPGLLAESIKSVARASRVAEIPVPYHTMISNIPGPPNTLSLGRAKLVAPLGFGPIRDNLGLFHIVSSSETIISLSFSACKNLLPDGGYYESCLQASFAGLLSTATENA